MNYKTETDLRHHYHTQPHAPANYSLDVAIRHILTAADAPTTVTVAGTTYTLDNGNIIATITKTKSQDDSQDN